MRRRSRLTSQLRDRGLALLLQQLHAGGVAIALGAEGHHLGAENRDGDGARRGADLSAVAMLSATAAFGERLGRRHEHVGDVRPFRNA